MEQQEIRELRGEVADLTTAVEALGCDLERAVLIARVLAHYQLGTDPITVEVPDDDDQQLTFPGWINHGGHARRGFEGALGQIRKEKGEPEDPLRQFALAAEEEASESGAEAEITVAEWVRRGPRPTWPSSAKPDHADSGARSQDSRGYPPPERGGSTAPPALVQAVMLYPLQHGGGGPMSDFRLTREEGG